MRRPIIVLFVSVIIHKPAGEEIDRAIEMRNETPCHICSVSSTHREGMCG
jgi:hypothetical protein